jgi:hypothetical protein
MVSGRPSGDGRHKPPRSLERVEEAPGHGADVVEELQGGRCLIAMHGACEAEETEVTVDLLRKSVGDAPVVGAVSSETAAAFAEVGDG